MRRFRLNHSSVGQSAATPGWRLGDRDAVTNFVRDLAARLSNRIQLTSDDHRVYLGCRQFSAGVGPWQSTLGGGFMRAQAKKRFSGCSSRHEDLVRT